MTSNKFESYQFFDKKQFSPRYGDNIFSCSFEDEPVKEKSLDASFGMLDSLANALGVTVGGGCCVPKNIVYYNITVYQGKYSWSVKRRYSEFTELYHKLTHGTHGGSALHNIVKDIDLPPSTLFDVADSPDFCRNRQEDLAYFLTTVLTSTSAKHLVTEDMLHFLGINDDDPNSASHKAKKEGK